MVTLYYGLVLSRATLWNKVSNGPFQTPSYLTSQRSLTLLTIPSFVKFSVYRLFCSFLCVFLSASLFLLNILALDNPIYVYYLLVNF